MIPARIFILIAFSLAILAAPPVLFAQAPPAPALQSAEILLQRGDAFYYQGDFYRAISAYKDFLFAHPTDPRAPSIRLKKAWIYHLSDQGRESAYQLHLLSQQEADYPRGWWARFYMGEVALENDRIPLAERSFQAILDLCSPQLTRYRAGAIDEASRNCLELTSRAHLAMADVQARRHNFDATIAHLHLLPPESPLATPAINLANQIKGLTIPQKSPALAGILSIIPGLGHLYIGDYGGAILATGWNGIFIYGLVDSILSRRYGQAAVIGLLESVWYGGTIFGAVAGAHRFNRDAFTLIEDPLRSGIDLLVPLEPWPTRFPASPAYLELTLEF